MRVQEPFDTGLKRLVVRLLSVLALNQIEVIAKRFDVTILIIILLPVEQGIPFVEEDLFQVLSFTSELPSIG